MVRYKLLAVLQGLTALAQILGTHQHGWGLHLKSERVLRLLAASIPMRVGPSFRWEPIRF